MRANKLDQKVLAIFGRWTVVFNLFIGFGLLLLWLAFLFWLSHAEL